MAPAKSPIETETIDAFLERLASPSPAPGGGAAAALTGAIAAALVAMTCRISLRHSTVNATLATGARSADHLREEFTRLAAEDTDAYTDVVKARRLPATARSEAVQSALRRATEVPLRLATRSCELLGLCDAVVPEVRPAVLNDLAVAAGLAWAALESGARTAESNLKDLDAAGFITTCERDLKRLVGEGAELRARFTERFATRA